MTIEQITEDTDTVDTVTNLDLIRLYVRFLKILLLKNLL